MLSIIQSDTATKNLQDENILIFFNHNVVTIVISLILYDDNKHISDNKNKLIVTRYKILSLKQ